MKLGVFLPVSGKAAVPEVLAEAAQQAEKEQRQKAEEARDLAQSAVKERDAALEARDAARRG